MARPEVHGKVLLTAEHEGYDERRTRIRCSVCIMEDGTVLTRTRKDGDLREVSTWIPSGRLGMALNLNSDSGWKLATRARLPEEARTDETARWILERPERALSYRSAVDLIRQIKLDPLPVSSTGSSTDRMAVPLGRRGRSGAQKKATGSSTGRMAAPPKSGLSDAIPSVERPDGVFGSDKTQSVQREHSTQYANVGRSRSAAKGTAARENGRKGGRPSKWSPQVRALAVQVLRTQASVQSADEPLSQELVRLAQAFEEGTLR